MLTIEDTIDALTDRAQKAEHERDEAREELETWAEAWKEYRVAHDTLGDGSPDAGRRWARLTQLERCVRRRIDKLREEWR